MIAVYSAGAYQVRDMWNMSLPHIEELQQAIIDKNKLEADAMNASSGKSTKTF